MSKPTRPSDLQRLLHRGSVPLSDPQWLALLLAKGTSRRATEHLPKKTWSSLALAEELYAAAGWQLTALVEQTLSGAIDWPRYGIGLGIGSRMLAAMELARRWHGDLESGGDERITTPKLHELSEAFFRRQAELTGGELIALLVGGSYPCAEKAEALLHHFGGLRGLLRDFRFEVFTPTENSSVPSFVPGGGEVSLGVVGCYRLLAAVELARRYRAQAKRPPLAADAALPPTSPEEELVYGLLDLDQPINPDQRETLIEALRTHPHFAEAMSHFEELARQAGTKDLREAAELQRTFDLLMARREWQEPAQLVGARVPYAGLLTIAEARIAGSRKPAARLLEVKQRLEQAQHEAATRPVAACLESLRELGVSEAAVARALAEIESPREVA